MDIRQAATQFLENRRIAVTGVSRDPDNHGGNTVFVRLRSRGYQVFAVNPNAESVEGEPCYPDLAAIPGGVDAVVIGTRPDHALATVQRCVELGIGQVWMHHGIGGSSVSAEATAYGRQHGVTVIDGGCPLMFGPTADAGHKVMCMLLKFTGAVPRRV